jgi:hypothetical protein
MTHPPEINYRWVIDLSNLPQIGGYEAEFAKLIILVLSRSSSLPVRQAGTRLKNLLIIKKCTMQPALTERIEIKFQTCEKPLKRFVKCGLY